MHTVSPDDRLDSNRSENTAARLAASPMMLSAVAAATVLAVAVGLLILGWPRGLRSESGGAELASLGLAIYGCVLTALMARDLRQVSWVVPGVFLLLALREMDFHDWFFEPGLLHTGIFSAPVPIWQKMVSGVVMLAVLALVIVALFRGIPILWRDFRRRETWAWVLGLAGTLAFISNNLDGLDRKLEPFGIVISRETMRVLVPTEEVLELAFAFGLIAAVTLYVRRHIRPGPPTRTASENA